MSIHRRLFREAFLHPWALTATVGLGLAAGILVIAQAGLFGRIIDRAFRQHQDLMALSLPLVSLLGLAILTGVKATRQKDPS